ncbi:uncharacterized protein LOC112266011 [Oncorhynchus tshawytscha]|uniref:uncharacterized protein LOC112266011 n=1 Tax=Oncorhynchus tshawytscha TaxID=74940 RepID=UPI001C3DC4D2|nr:uncharacterized protein LOC112266011 [Oncorhynchus tshawytscha]
MKDEGGKDRATSCSTGSNVDPSLTRHQAIEIHPLEDVNVDLNEEGTVRRWTVGTNNLKANKTVLLMGVTGVGKSTLINYIANYILGVNFEDNKRFQLIPDEKKSQTASQTTAITVYEIFGHEGDRVPFSVTIIDTPGFGDTNGIEQDQLITKNLQELFKSKNGVHQIDAVCFVVREDEVRLTLTQHYIFESILSIFGKDIEKNILALITFIHTGTVARPQDVGGHQVRHEAQGKVGASGRAEQNDNQDNYVTREDQCTAQPQAQNQMALIRGGGVQAGGVGGVMVLHGA